MAMDGSVVATRDGRVIRVDDDRPSGDVEFADCGWNLYGRIKETPQWHHDDPDRKLGWATMDVEWRDFLDYRGRPWEARCTYAGFASDGRTVRFEFEVHNRSKRGFEMQFEHVAELIQMVNLLSGDVAEVVNIDGTISSKSDAAAAAEDWLS